MSLFRTFALSAALPSAGAQAATQQQRALAFLAAERIRQGEHATAADVDRALAFLTDSIVYEHPNAGARITGKALLWQGETAYLGATRSARDSIITVVAVPGVVVMNVVSMFEEKASERWIMRRRRGIKVIEFDGLLIRRVIDYWERL